MNRPRLDPLPLCLGAPWCMADPEGACSISHHPDCPRSHHRVPPRDRLSDEELHEVAAEAQRWQELDSYADPIANHPELSAVSWAYAVGVVTERLRSRARIVELERGLAECREGEQVALRKRDEYQRMATRLTLALREALPAVSWAWTDAQTDPHEQDAERQFEQAHLVCNAAFDAAFAAGLLDGER